MERALSIINVVKSVSFYQIANTWKDFSIYQNQSIESKNATDFEKDRM